MSSKSSPDSRNKKSKVVRFFDYFFVLRPTLMFPFWTMTLAGSGISRFQNPRSNVEWILLSVALSLLFGLIYLLDLGAVGLAYKMIIAQFIGVNIQLYFNSKFLDLDMKYFVLHQLYSVIFFVVLAYISAVIISLNSPLYEFLVSGAVYTLLVIVGVYIFPQVFSTTRDEIKDNLIRIKKGISKKIV